MSNRSPRVPKYRRHSSGQARVTIDGKDRILGPYGSPESQEPYRRIIAEWLETRQRPAAQPGEKDEPLTVNELILSYWRFADDYYGLQDGAHRGDAYCQREALRVV